MEYFTKFEINIYIKWHLKSRWFWSLFYVFNILCGCDFNSLLYSFRHKVIQKTIESENNLKHIKKYHRPEKKYHHSKRQLFFNDDPKKIAPIKCDQQAQQFFAPSWLNFKFDKIAIMECMP